MLILLIVYTVIITTPTVCAMALVANAISEDYMTGNQVDWISILLIVLIVLIAIIAWT